LITWIAQFCSQPSIAKRKPKNKSHTFPFPTKRPECPLCQAEEEVLPSKAMPPEPPPLIKHTRGRRRSIYTDLRFCPNNDCEYYGWLARGNICGNGHPNSGKWRQLKCIVCETYFMETQGTIFYCSKASPDKIILALKIMSEGVGIQSTSRILDLDANTVQDWLKKSSEHMEAVCYCLADSLRSLGGYMRIRQSIGNMINTSFVERMNLTLRHHVPALARRTIQIAKTILGLEQQLLLTGAYYNFCLPHSSLRQPLPVPIPTKGNGSPKLWRQVTPAMAAGITDRVLAMEDLYHFHKITVH
jgi:hypothetical protein